jgi:hypothetical protein
VLYEVLAASEHSAAKYTDQTYTVRYGLIEFHCDAVILLAAAVESCAVLDCVGSDLHWKIGNFLQLVRRSKTNTA